MVVLITYWLYRLSEIHRLLVLHLTGWVFLLCSFCVCCPSTIKELAPESSIILSEQNVALPSLTFEFLSVVSISPLLGCFYLTVYLMSFLLILCAFFWNFRFISSLPVGGISFFPDIEVFKVENILLSL